jgi:hypothetical protein
MIGAVDCFQERGRGAAGGALAIATFGLGGDASICDIFDQKKCISGISRVREGEQGQIEGSEVTDRAGNGEEWRRNL